MEEVGENITEANVETETEEATDSVATETEYVVVALNEDVEEGAEITEDNLKGVVLSAEQYARYSCDVYVSSDGDISSRPLLEKIVEEANFKGVKKGDFFSFHIYPAHFKDNQYPLIVAYKGNGIYLHPDKIDKYTLSQFSSICDKLSESK